jgi:hypothetical protein
MTTRDLLDELRQRVLGLALATAEGASAVDLAAGHWVSTPERAELPRGASLAQMPLHRTDPCVPTVGSVVAAGECGAMDFAADSVVTSSKLGCCRSVEDSCDGAELGKCGGPPGSRSRHLGIKSPLLFRMS